MEDALSSGCLRVNTIDKHSSTPGATTSTTVTMI